MQNTGNNDGPDQMARDQAALAAQARARQAADGIAAAHAAGVYDQARQNAVGYVLTHRKFRAARTGGSRPGFRNRGIRGLGADRRGPRVER